MAAYKVVIHSGDTPSRPFAVDLDPSKQLLQLAVLMDPLVKRIRHASDSKRGIAWRFLVRREDGSWDELDPMESPVDQRLPAGATIFAHDITEELSSSD